VTPTNRSAAVGCGRSFEMTRAFNEGTIKPLRTRENTTPTRFEDFAVEWASAYKAM
jgi:hypothetical protein